MKKIIQFRKFHKLIGLVWFLIIIFVISSCGLTRKGEKPKNKTKAVYTPLSSNRKEKEDSISTIQHFLPNKTVSLSPNEILYFTGKDLIISCNDNYFTDLIDQMEHTIKMWNKVEFPLVAIFKGSDFGDYFHLHFKDINDKMYDFGFGNNNTGAYELYFDNDQIEDNPIYLDNKFKIYWSWTISTYPCCSGGYDIVKTYYPSIDSLILIQ